MGDDRAGRPGPTEPATDQGPGRRLTVPEAAAALGISADAVRSRIKRGTLQTEREGGRVFVVLVGAARARPANDQAATDQPTDQGREEDRTAELIATLREQLQAERQAHAEARRIIAGLVERMPPQLEAPQESPPDAPGPPDAGGGAPSGGTAPDDRETPAERRPWWRRVFGG